MKEETQRWKGLLPFSLGTAMKLILSCGCFRQRWLDSSSKDLKWSIRPIASEMTIQKCLKLLINDVFLMNWTKISVPKYSSGCLTSSLIKPCLQFHTRMKSSIISTRYEIGWNHTWFDFNQVWNWNHTFSTKSLLLNHTIVLIVPIEETSLQTVSPSSASPSLTASSTVGEWLLVLGNFHTDTGWAILKPVLLTKFCLIWSSLCSILCHMLDTYPLETFRVEEWCAQTYVRTTTDVPRRPAPQKIC